MYSPIRDMELTLWVVHFLVFKRVMTM
jgi:hypothetical protein